MPDIRARKITPAIQVLVWFAAHPEMAFTALSEPASGAEAKGAQNG